MKYLCFLKLLWIKFGTAKKGWVTPPGAWRLAQPEGVVAIAPGIRPWLLGTALSSFKLTSTCLSSCVSCSSPWEPLQWNRPDYSCFPNGMGPALTCWNSFPLPVASVRPVAGPLWQTLILQEALTWTVEKSPILLPNTNESNWVLWSESSGTFE